MTQTKPDARAFAGALALGLDRRAAYVAAACAGYWSWRGVGIHRAVDWGIRDAQAEKRRRDIERQMRGKVA